jgi:hypothetical protein
VHTTYIMSVWFLYGGHLKLPHVTTRNQTTTVHKQKCLKTKEQIHQRYTLQHWHGIQPVSFHFYMTYVTCRVLNKNSNVVVQLNLGRHHGIFNSSSLTNKNQKQTDIISESLTKGTRVLDIYTVIIWQNAKCRQCFSSTFLDWYNVCLLLIFIRCIASVIKYMYNSVNIYLLSSRNFRWGVVLCYGA